MSLFVVIHFRGGQENVTFTVPRVSVKQLLTVLITRKYGMGLD
jgi:hypothetical protein